MCYVIPIISLTCLLISDFGLGKSIEHIQSAAVTIHIKDPILRYAITLSRISQAFQLLFDNLYLFSKIGLLRLDHQNLSSTSTKFWLYADLLNLIRVLYEIKRELGEQARIQEINLKHGKHTFYSTLRCTVARRPELFVEFLKHFSDIWLPLNSSGFVNISPGTAGLCGTISSVLGAIAVWDKTNKLLY